MTIGNGMNMFKRIKGVALSLCLIMGMFTVLPGEINAAPEGTPISNKDIKNLTAGPNIGPAITITEDGIYYLAEDIRDTNLVVVTVDGGKDVTIDLNGKTLRGGVDVKKGTPSDHTTLILKDSAGGGKIDGDNVTVSNVIPGVYMYENCDLTMEGGTICNNNDGGVYMCGEDNFTMNGGVISGNKQYYGGGVRNDGGTFTMNGGMISGNEAVLESSLHGWGGGVYNYGTFLMNGGVISGNHADKLGGGVYNDKSFTMNNGTISGNTASDEGGGIYNHGTLGIDKATISENKAANGGGIYWWFGQATIKGGTIKNNTTNAAPPVSDDIYIGNTNSKHDFYLEGAPDIGVIRFTGHNNHGAISLSGPLTNKEPIAIDAPYSQGNPYVFAKKSDEGPNPSDYIFQFRSKNESYGIGYNKKSEAAAADSLKLAPAAPAPKSITVYPNDIKAFTGYSDILPFTAKAETTYPGILTGYQWYTNTVNSNEGGTPIEGATEKEYTCPSGLAEGTYYYYCMVKTISMDASDADARYVVRRDPGNVVYLEVSPVPVEGVSLDKDAFTVQIGSSFTLTPTISPSNAANKKVTWESDRPDIATVENGVVTGKGLGDAMITVRTEDGNKAATCRVKVVGVPVSGVTLNKTSLRLECGQKETLFPTISPANATDKTLTWSTSNKKVATVSNEGVVTAEGGGSATITATSSNGKTVGCKVKVKEYKDIKQVYVLPCSLNLKVGKTRTLKAIILPTNARNKKVIWASRNPKIATVTPTGKVTAIKKGTTYITVTAADGKKTKKIKVTVRKKKR